MQYQLYNTFYRFSLKRKQLLFLIAPMFLMIAGPVQAEEEVKDKFRISLGSYTLVRSESSMSLTDPDFGAGISISPEDTLGLKTEQTVVRLNGYYRFTNKHALTYSWYSIGSDGSKVLDTEFEWLDEDDNQIVIPIGANVDTSLDYDIFKVGYLWSFYNSDKVELSAGAGLHVTRLAVDLTAEATGLTGEAKNVSTSVPLPVLSLSLVYRVTPKFSWHVKSELFALKFDDWDGTYQDTTLGMEYRFVKHFALGIGLSGNALKITEDSSDHKFGFDNRITGVLIDAVLYF